MVDANSPWFYEYATHGAAAQEIIVDDPIHGTAFKITAAEMHRRREAIRQAEANTRLAGQSCSPEAEAIFEAFVRGEIEVTDILPRLQALHGQTF